MRKAGDTTADAATIRKACDAYARKYIDIQRAQFKRLGVLGDWENPYLTLNKEYEADELRLFADIVAKGFVYRGKKPVYWSIPCRTALAEAEVEYHDHVSQSVFVKFPVVGQPKTFIVIWTTTPWTLPANLAVAYNKNFNTSSKSARKLHFFRGLAAAVAEKCGWTNYTKRPFPDENSRSCNTSIRSAIAPAKLSPPILSPATPARASFTSRPATVWTTTISAAKTACRFIRRWMTTALCLHERLPVEQQMPPKWSANPFWKSTARATPTKPCCTNLRVRHALLHQENYHHSYPHCWRSKTPIIFRAMDQWFIKIDHEKDDVPGAAHSARAFVRPLLKLSAGSPGRIDRVNGFPIGASTASKARCNRGPTGASAASAPGACRFRRFTTRKANRSSTRKSSATPPT
jgi:isoleucyl-tRNA synthetase